MKLKKLLKMMIKLEMTKAVGNDQLEEGTENSEANKSIGGLVVGKLSLEEHFRQIYGTITRIAKDHSESSELIKENHKLLKENIKLVNAMSKSHKALLDELQATRKELQELKACMEEEFSSIRVNELKADTGKFITIFTDASYDQTTEQCTYGIVSLPDDGKINEYSGTVELLDELEKKTISYGEAFAIIKALTIVRGLGYKEALVYTDNLCVSDWAEMGNQTDSKEGQWFYRRITELKEAMDITIMWKKRCSCEYNTRADELAKVSLAQCNFMFYDNKAKELSC